MYTGLGPHLADAVAGATGHHALHLKPGVHTLFEILTVCTGNICRSPLAAQLLRMRLAHLRPAAVSAGTRVLHATGMTPEAARIAVRLGVPTEEAERHRSRHLTATMLTSPALILTMTRDHRRAVAELAPARLRSTFTIREFARLSSAVAPEELRLAAQAAGPDAAAQIRALGIAVASVRGLVLPLADPADDDVIDPYGSPWRVYRKSAAQLEPAVDAVVDIVSSTLSAPAA